jgi:hypothetical protein
MNFQKRAILATLTDANSMSHAVGGVSVDGKLMDSEDTMVFSVLPKAAK